MSDATTTKSLPAGITKVSKKYSADPARIRVQPEGETKRNTRFDFGDLEQDLGSMKTQGFHEHEPLLVRRIKGDPDFDFEIIDGERRLTYIKMLHAAKQKYPAGLDPYEVGVPVVIEDKNATDVELLLKMYNSNRGKPFLPLEEAHAFKKLRDAGLSLKEIMKYTGRSDVHISEALALLEADVVVQDAVKEKKVSASLAKQISVKARGDKTKQKELVEKAQQGKQARRAVTEEVQRMAAPSRRKLSAVAKEVKAKPLGAAQLEELLQKVHARFEEGRKNHGKRLETVVASAAKDDAEVAAFLAGAYLGLQAALGHKVNLDL